MTLTQRIRVLIVDDSVSMRQMVGFTLREGGFEVVEAEHGQDGAEFDFGDIFHGVCLFVFVFYILLS